MYVLWSPYDTTVQNITKRQKEGGKKRIVKRLNFSHINTVNK